MAYHFMHTQRNRYTITEMAGVLGVSRSAYYQWLKYGESPRRAEADGELVALMRAIVTRHQYRYGSPRVRRKLRSVYGRVVSMKKVARLMRENGLNARWRRKSVRTTNSDHGYAVCANRLDRQFHAAEGGQKWVSDIRYLYQSLS